MEGTSGAVDLVLFSRRCEVCGPSGGHCESEPAWQARSMTRKGQGGRRLQAVLRRACDNEVSESIGLGRSSRRERSRREGPAWVPQRRPLTRETSAGSVLQRAEPPMKSPSLGAPSLMRPMGFDGSRGCAHEPRFDCRSRQAVRGLRGLRVMSSMALGGLASSSMRSSGGASEGAKEGRKPARRRLSCGHGVRLPFGCVLRDAIGRRYLSTEGAPGRGSLPF